MPAPALRVLFAAPSQPLSLPSLNRPILLFFYLLSRPAQAFLEAARKERLKGSRAFTKRQLSLLPAGKREWEEVEGPEGDAAGGGAHGALPAADESGSDGGKEEGKAASRDGALAEEEPFERAVSLNRQGTLSRLHGDTSYSKVGRCVAGAALRGTAGRPAATGGCSSAGPTDASPSLLRCPLSAKQVPMLRVLRNNAAGILLQIAYSAWVSGALYVTNSWLPSQLRKAGMDRRLSQVRACVRGAELVRRRPGTRRQRPTGSRPPPTTAGHLAGLHRSFPYLNVHRGIPSGPRDARHPRQRGERRGHGCLPGAGCGGSA